MIFWKFRREDMALITEEFKQAVEERNLLRIRIIMKNSLLIYKSAQQFNEMKDYANRQGINIYMKDGEEFDPLPEKLWDENLLNLELAKLINDFTIKRAKYCLHILCKIDKDKYKDKKEAKVKRQRNYNQEYQNILNAEKGISEILKKSKIPKGRIWMDKDIRKIKQYAQDIVMVCENIIKD